MNILAGALLPQFNHAMGIIATEAGVNSGPGGWMPELRGILIIVIAVFTLMGSVYLIMLTNVGARLGFLIVFSALAGWMFIMGCMWWAYGIGLKGPEPTWEAVNARTVLQDTNALVQAGALDSPVVVDASATPIEVANSVREEFVAEGWKQLVPSAAAFGQTSSQAEVYLIGTGAFGTGGFKVVNVFDNGGERYPRWFDGKIDFVAFWHKPRHVIVEVAPVLQQRSEPGRAPSPAVIDENAPHQYV
ncbi:MAG: hypothetical protein JWN99_1797, partial [Ilumatobacteraceae bacterium]|nr:hypothetical protein [Ilumatobacteraceae bacterium]